MFNYEMCFNVFQKVDIVINNIPSYFDTYEVDKNEYGFYSNKYI